MRDSNFSTRGHVRRECHHPNLWQRRASFFEVHIHHCTKQNFFPQLTLLSKTFSFASNTVISGTSESTTCFHCDIGLRNWVPGDIAFAEHEKWSPFCVYVTFVKGKTFIDESRRIARQNGTGDIFTVALNE